MADDNAQVRDLLHAVLGQSRDFEVAVAVADASSAIAAAGEHHPDIALVDVRMPGGGPAAARGIRKASPGTRIIALSSYDDAVTVRLMLAAGATSYVVKGTPHEELLDVMRRALAPPEPAQPPPSLSDEPRRILVALTDPGALDAVADAVVATPGLELVGLAQTAFHTLSLATRLRPDIAVVDAGLGDGDTAVAASLAVASSRTRIVTWTTEGSEHAGASRPNLVISAADPAGALREAVERVSADSGRPGAGSALVVLRSAPAPAGPLPSRGRFERLASVLASDQLEMHLQPIVDLAGEQPQGYEALARFPGHPHPGPDLWFAEAHRAEVGVELERLAVRSALEELGRLPEGTFLSVNVSPDTALSPELREDLAAADAQRVVVELTEHAPVHDYAALGKALDALRALGTRVAIDDCGAGFTSLRHVALIAPDYLKLDMVLCRDVREPSRAALTRALVLFAGETGSRVIAEGIENPDDLAALRELGVELGQGYLFARPGPIAALV